MAISFGCPHCGRRFEVPDHLEGKQARCQTCGNVVVIRREMPAEPDLLSISELESRATGQGSPLGVVVRSPGGVGMPRWLVMSAVGGGVLVLGLILFLVFSPGGGDDRANRRQGQHRQGGEPSVPPPRLSSGLTHPATHGEKKLEGMRKGPSKKVVEEPPKDETYSAPVTWEADGEPHLPGLRFVDVGEGYVRYARFARDTPRVVVVRKIEERSLERSWAALYDLASDRLLGTVELPKDTEVMALSPDGATMLVVRTGLVTESDWLTVWSWQEGTARLSAEVKPLDRRTRAAWAKYLTPDQFLVKNDRGNTSLVDGSKGGALREFGELENSTMALSPQGQRLAAFSRNYHGSQAIRIHSPLTGEIMASREVPLDDSVDLLEMSFSPDGKHFAALFNSVGKSEYALFYQDMSSLRPMVRLNMPGSQVYFHRGDGLWWCGKDYLALGQMVCHLGEDVPAWYYRNKILGQLPDGRVWLLVTEFGHNHLAAVSLPLPSDQAIIDKELSHLRPVLDAGGSVRIDVQGANEVPAGLFEQGLRQAIANRLEKRGYRVATDAPHCLRVSVSDESVAPSRGALGDEKERSEPDRVVHFDLKLVDVQDRVRWKFECNHRVPGSYIAREKQRDPGGVAKRLEGRWEQFAKDVKEYEFPVPWYEGELNEGFGTTTITREMLLANHGAGLARNGSGTPGLGAEGAPTAGLGLQWSYEPDPIPSPTREFVSRQVRLDDARLLDARFAGPEAAQVAVLMEGSRTSESESEVGLEGPSKARRYVQRVDLTNSEVLGSFDVPESAELLDFRPDGRVVAIRLRGDGAQVRNELHIWTCSDKGDQCVLRHTPYENRSMGRLSWAALVGTNRLLTQDIGKTLDLWQLPDGRRLDSIVWKSRTPPALSGQRKYIAAPRKDAMAILRTEDFSLVGHLKAPVVYERWYRDGAFDREGKRFAAIGTHFSCTSAKVWDLERGELVTEFPTSTQYSRHFWVDSRYYYAGGLLLDIEEEAVVWDYGSDDLCIPASPDGRFWYAAFDRKHRPSLWATRVPSSNALERIKRVLRGAQVLGPGGSVNVRMKKEGDPDAEFCRKFMELAKEGLGKRGLKVASGASVSVEITVRDEPTGSTVSPGGPYGEEEPLRCLDVRLEYLGPEGRKYWEAHEVWIVVGRSPGLVHGTDLSPWETFEAWWKLVVLPCRIYRWSDDEVPGTSLLMADGEHITDQ